MSLVQIRNVSFVGMAQLAGLVMGKSQFKFLVVVLSYHVFVATCRLIFSRCRNRCLQILYRNVSNSRDLAYTPSQMRDTMQLHTA
jgi:hypothetical protein